MSPFHFGRSALLALAFVGIAAAAQPSRSARPDPLDAAASVPGAHHESAFKGYRRFGATSVVPWRDANDTVDRIGGWRSYAREAQASATPPARAPAAAASAPSAEPARPAGRPGGHDGHRH